MKYLSSYFLSLGIFCTGKVIFFIRQEDEHGNTISPERTETFNVRKCKRTVRLMIRKRYMHGSVQKSRDRAQKKNYDHANPNPTNQKYLIINR